MAASRSRARTRYLSVPDVAEELGVSVRTVRRWIAAGRLPILRPSPRCIRVDPAELDRLLATKAGA